eukprot:IDg11479t1
MRTRLTRIIEQHCLAGRVRLLIQNTTALQRSRCSPVGASTARQRRGRAPRGIGRLSCAAEMEAPDSRE